MRLLKVVSVDGKMPGLYFQKGAILLYWEKTVAIIQKNRKGE